MNAVNHENGLSDITRRNTYAHERADKLTRSEGKIPIANKNRLSNQSSLIPRDFDLQASLRNLH